jgi:hypothetical protein
MINMRRAFTKHTTLKAYLQTFQEGSWDENNEWTEGTMSRPMPFLVTATPTGSADEGSYGARLNADNIGERTKKFMQFTSRTDMPMNSIITVYNDKYKVVREGYYDAMGFHTVVAEGVSDKTHWEDWL